MQAHLLIEHLKCCSTVVKFEACLRTVGEEVLGVILDRIPYTEGVRLGYLSKWMMALDFI